ncbi:MAG: molecular chaperone TorD family protein [Acidobacteriota bacterium]
MQTSSDPATDPRLRRSAGDSGRPLEELIQVNRFRESLYSFLSRLFSREVDPGFWHAIQDSIGAIHWVEDSSGCPGHDDIVAAFRGLKEFSRAVERRDAAEVLRELGRQYAFLFLGVGRETVPLCESAYTGATATLYQDAYFDVRKKLEDSGLRKAEGCAEPEDHVAIELAHMACLSRRMGVNLSEGATVGPDVLANQRGFLTGHLLNWAPDLAERITTVSPGSFYAPAARLLAGFLRLDQELIDFLRVEWMRNVDVERHA